MNFGALECCLFGFLLVAIAFAPLVVLGRARLRNERYRQFYEALWDATGPVAEHPEDGEPELRRAAAILALASFPERLASLGPVVDALEQRPGGPAYQQAVAALRQAHRAQVPQNVR